MKRAETPKSRAPAPWKYVGVGYLPVRVSPTSPSSPPFSLRRCLSRSLSASLASFSA
jgi:hypothetical protein